MNNILLLISCIVGCELVGILSGIPTMKAVRTWYKTLKKPSFNPPSSVFGPVWTVLYALMGISLYLIITSSGNKSFAYVVFALQLLANFLWSFLFFTFKRLDIAFYEIVLLLFLILLCIVLFWPTNIFASLLLLPYLLWVNFATVLNFSLWKLNERKRN